MECMNFSATCEWQPHRSMVGVQVTTQGDRGFLNLCFQVNGKPIAQTFELSGSVMRVGGVRWWSCPRLTGQEPPGDLPECGFASGKGFMRT